MTELARFSYELNEEMLGLIAQEFGIQQLVSRFAQAISSKKTADIDNIAKEIFGRYGMDWIRKSLQLGDEYPDRTYQFMMEAIKSTGGHLRFPLLPQRVLEIAYLSTQDLEFLPVLENNPRRLVYRIDNCKMFQALNDECGREVANMLACRHACLSACRALFDDLGYPGVPIKMEASTNKDGYCQFVVSRT